MAKSDKTEGDAPVAEAPAAAAPPQQQQSFQVDVNDSHVNAAYANFCRVTGSTPLVSPAGGSNSGGCQPPRPSQIDWIFGSPNAGFSEYQIDRGPLVRHTSDHPILVTKVTIDARKFPKSYTPSGG